MCACMDGNNGRKERSSIFPRSEHFVYMTYFHAHHYSMVFVYNIVSEPKQYCLSFLHIL